MMYNFQSIYTLGFVMGPALNVLFLHINIHIGPWIINKYNFIGIFLAMVLICYNVLVYLLLHDLSNPTQAGSSGANNHETQPGSSRPNNHETQTGSSRPNNHETQAGSSRPNSSEMERKGENKSGCVRRNVFASFPIMMLILSSSLNNFIAVLTELTIPILSNKVFMWSIERLSVVTTLCVTVFAIAMIAVGAASLVTSERVFSMYLCCFAGLCVSISLLVLPAYIVVNSTSVQVVVVVFVTLLNSCCGLMSVALAKSMFLTLVPSENASLYEGARCVVYRVFGFTAFLTTSFLFPYLSVVAPILIILLIVCLLVFCVRRNYFSGRYSLIES